MPQIKNQSGQIVSDWRKWPAPKRSYHWKAGRSAMELARAWFTAPAPRCPDEVSSLLATHPDTKNATFTDGYPEHVTWLPFSKGTVGHRNHDLMLRGHVDGQKVVACVEAKADEPFGSQTVGQYWKSSQASNKPTNVPKRILALLDMLFGPQAQPDQAPWSDLRYQLLAGVAGTAIEAAKDNAPIAVFLVHEFQTHYTDRTKIALSMQDYENFVQAFMAHNVSVVSGQMYGPKLITANQHLQRDVQLFVGKAVFAW